jgi:transporter family-2 protein
VNVVVLLTQRLGVGMTLALAIAGQMSAALLLDHAGLLGLPIRQVTARHMLGAALLVAGVVLIRR